MDRSADFFAYARERYDILLRRQVGDPPPWTENSAFLKYSFCNVFREDDRVTRWLRHYVREPMKSEINCLMATVLFRWFNRTECGHLIFVQRHGDQTPWETLTETGETKNMRDALDWANSMKRPYTTGAYIITSPTGMTKLDGILHFVGGFYRTSHWRSEAERMLQGQGIGTSMQKFTRWLSQYPGMGPFLAYEVACDLRHTALLDKADDIDTWANVGPGAQRGLNRVHDRRARNPKRVDLTWQSPISDFQAVNEMRKLLELSRNPEHWPYDRQWDMRTVEHTLCEFDKMERVKAGEGEPKENYAPGIGLDKRWTLHDYQHWV